MASQQQLIKFKSCVQNRFQFDSVFALVISEMFASGLNAHERSRHVKVYAESDVLNDYKIMHDLMNDTVSVHKDLKTLLPTSLPISWSKTIIELSPDLSEIRSLTSLTSHNIVAFIRQHDLEHLQPWIDYYEKVK